MRVGSDAFALLAVLCAALLLSLGCGPEEEAAEDMPETAPEASDGARGEARTGSEETESERGSRGAQEGALLVPIVHLTSSAEDLTLEELSRTTDLAVAQNEAVAARGVLDAPDLAEFPSAFEVVEHVSRNPVAVGLVPWEEVNPRVKALAVEGESLLEPGASGSEGYPLRRGEPPEPDPSELRRVVVGGDVVMDRGMPFAVFMEGRGLSFPLDGGYAGITSLSALPSPYSEFGFIHDFEAERRGGRGAVREYLRSADLVLANLENPVVEEAVYHPEETTFTGDPRLMDVLADAGIDGVTLANNHVLDAGPSGIEQTFGYLEDAGISRTGAGADLAEAREPMVFDLGGLKLGVVNHQGVPGYEWAWATETAPGTAPLDEEVVLEDIRRLRPEVDVLVWMPHWGKEYEATPEPEQVELARAAVDAGADAVVGGHAHWPKGIEVHEDAPVFYGVGNFLFDQNWSLETSTGIFAELTLYGDRVVQAEPVPFILLERAQPNFLLPEAGGNRALQTIFSVSVGPEFEAYEREAPVGTR